jgi:predicted ATP-grasp superfamily ATP-dependent carboligase
MISLGYFGNVGIDAMLYGSPVTLHPIVEINARKTMGWVALEVQKRHFPNQTLTLSYAKNSAEGWLPSSLGDTLFTRQLMIFAR